MLVVTTENIKGYTVIKQMAVIYIWGGLALIALFSWFVWDKRYGHSDGMDVPPGYADEVFLDPIKGKKQRGYYNAKPVNGFITMRTSWELLLPSGGSSFLLSSYFQ